MELLFYNENADADNLKHLKLWKGNIMEDTEITWLFHNCWMWLSHCVWLFATGWVIDLQLTDVADQNPSVSFLLCPVCKHGEVVFELV